MRKKIDLTKMSKAELAELLAKKKEEYKLLIGESTLLAAPEKFDPIKQQPGPLLPKENLRENAWQEYLKALESGTYMPDTDFQEPLSARERQALEPSRRRSHLAKYGPTWRDEDGRGYKKFKT